MHLYRTILYKDTSTVIDPPASNDTDKTDFENNHKSTAVVSTTVPKITEGPIIKLSYTDFKAKVDGEILWSDVFYVDGDNSYEIFLQAHETGDTRNQRQRYSDLGELFSVSTNKVTFSASAGTETPFIFFENPSASGVKVKFAEVQCRIHDVSSYSVILRAYHMPTITANGTTLTAVKENMAGSYTAQTNWYVSPTASANGTFRNAFQFSHEIPLNLNYDLSHQMGAPSKMLFTLEKNIAGNVDVLMTFHFVEEQT